MKYLSYLPITGRYEQIENQFSKSADFEETVLSA